MRRRSAPDSARVSGKTNLTAAQTRTWVLPLTGRKRVYFCVKEDSSTGSGINALTIKSRAHGDRAWLTVTPVDPAASQTWNAGLVGATHGAAFSDAVLKGNGYVVAIVPPGFSQTTSSPVSAQEGYCADAIQVIATCAGGATATGLELIVFEAEDSASGANG